MRHQPAVRGFEIALRSLTYACAICFSGSLAAADCLATRWMYPGHGPIPIDLSILPSQYLAPLSRVASISPQMEVDENTYSSHEQLVVSVRQVLDVKKCKLIIVESLQMTLLNGGKFLYPSGRRNPFDNIDSVFKQRSVRSNENAKVVLVSIGWIPKNAPNLEVDEKQIPIVIKIRNGHKGWWDYSIAATAPPNDGNHLDAIFDWATSAEANKIMGQWFWIVPDNSLLKRKLRIDLIGDDGKVVASSPCDSSKCFPTLSRQEVTFKGTDGKTYSVCGKATACPPLNAMSNFSKVNK